MRKSIRTLTLSALMLAATLAAGSARAQFADDWQHVATACTPSTPAALSQAQFNVGGGYIRANNPNAGTVHYTCNVLDSFNAPVSAWNDLTLQYRDAAGGRVVATLYAKNKVNGATAVIASAVSPASAAINNVSVNVPPLNFAMFGYYVVISITSSANNPPQAHMVSLHQ